MQEAYRQHEHLAEPVQRDDVLEQDGKCLRGVGVLRGEFSSLCISLPTGEEC